MKMDGVLWGGVGCRRVTAIGVSAGTTSDVSGNGVGTASGLLTPPALAQLRGEPSQGWWYWFFHPGEPRCAGCYGGEHCHQSGHLGIQTYNISGLKWTDLYCNTLTTTNVTFVVCNISVPANARRCKQSAIVLFSQNNKSCLAVFSFTHRTGWSRTDEDCAPAEAPAAAAAVAAWQERSSLRRLWTSP